ncbi:type-I signal peptidase [Staphylococcus piscifermentans]|uniref:Signal peptidase I n=1 Tax=Staphylococcus piscifermentans TaxID=70258 RepID=A0A239UAW0_9STAP|nr:signal peptidase I [Staphylococcus piscifermentans]RTX86332.1 signal peptidase I [Staphylococcus piscifermentans]GEP83924.1 signal peptidase I [Staphylococcus piscifermentans]SNV07032.1 type-I signal peptidase [Staphylococcus piscifermentans]
MRKIVKYLLSLIIAIIIVMLIQAFLIIGAVVPNNEMSPALKHGDRILISKVQNTFNRLHNGDIVMYKQKGNTYFGRVIGLPGQSVEFKDSRLYRDDQMVKENYRVQAQIKNLALRNVKHSEGDIVPPKQYFILNDNRADSNDSRTFGTIQQKDIVGNVVLRYYPWNKFGISFNE